MDDESGLHERERDADLKRIARVVAAEILSTAGAERTQLTATASQAASALSETAAQAAIALAQTTRLDLDYIKKDITEIKALLASKFITSEAFVPVRNLVYGLVGLILTGVFVGLLTSLIRKP